MRESPSPCYAHAGHEFSFALTNGGNVVTVSTPQGTVLDVLDTTGWGITSGEAFGLNPTLLDATSNDSEGNWCLQTTALATDFGTPGAPNDPC